MRYTACTKKSIQYGSSEGACVRRAQPFAVSADTESGYTIYKHLPSHFTSTIGSVENDPLALILPVPWIQMSWRNLLRLWDLACGQQRHRNIHLTLDPRVYIKMTSHSPCLKDIIHWEHGTLQCSSYNQHKILCRRHILYGRNFSATQGLKTVRLVHPPRLSHTNLL